MAAYQKSPYQSPPSTTRRTSSTGPAFHYDQSVKSTRSSPSTASSISPRLSPRVQLVPHARTASYDLSLSDSDRELLQSTNFDTLDLSSKDFQFEDLFLYDNPQKKLTKVVEVSSPAREQRFSYSYYGAAAGAVGGSTGKLKKLGTGSGTGIGEKYLKNQRDQRKHT